MRQPKRFITSDTHFWHKNIIEYEKRPFVSIEHMNDAMVKRWNAVVGKQDIVYHLGDLSFSVPMDYLAGLLDSLNGEIVLVCGNHDAKSQNRLARLGRFREIVRYPHKLIVDDNVILSHIPMRLGDDSPFINIYGHVHGNADFRTIDANGACVCVERWDYRPVDYEWLLSEIYKRKKWQREVKLS